MIRWKGGCRKSKVLHDVSQIADVVSGDVRVEVIEVKWGFESWKAEIPRLSGEHMLCCIS